MCSEPAQSTDCEVYQIIAAWFHWQVGENGKSRLDLRVQVGGQITMGNQFLRLYCPGWGTQAKAIVKDEFSFVPAKVLSNVVDEGSGSLRP